MPHRAILAAIALVCATVVAHAGETCRASYYGPESGNRTANGERFNPDGISAAHRTLPFGTRVRVTYRGRSVVVRINDRGPAKWTSRCIDLSRGAARAIGMISAGVGTVTLEVLSRPARISRSSRRASSID